LRWVRIAAAGSPFIPVVTHRPGRQTGAQREIAMRFIIYGLGAVGGTIAAALTQSGQAVVGIARGKMLEAIKADGLLFRTPDGAERVRFPVFAAPAEIDFENGDIAVLTMKSQDTAAALVALRDAGFGDRPVVCAQNGVNNERLALRYFANVYGATVMTPADYTIPGEVTCFGTPRHAILDIGRYPRGLDDNVTAIAAALTRANLAITPMEEVMRSKYGKLVENLGNVVEAALGQRSAPLETLARGNKSPGIMAAARSEAEAVYSAAGIERLDVGWGSARRKGVMEMGPVEGYARVGGSSTQSLKRGAGSIETDFLNGEIVLLGRLHGVPTPVNAALCEIGRELVGEGAVPGSMSAEALSRRLGLG
jgi:2-dehydropantoate 2-reductase